MATVQLMKAASEEAEDGGGAGDFHGGAGAEEQAGADGASDGDHGHLSGGELVAEAFFVDRWCRRHAAS